MFCAPSTQHNVFKRDPSHQHLSPATCFSFQYVASNVLLFACKDMFQATSILLSNAVILNPSF